MSTVQNPTPDCSQLSDNDLRELVERLGGLGYDVDLTADRAGLIRQFNAAMAEGTNQVPESEWFAPLPCPAWCLGDHSREHGEPYQECESEDIFLPRADGTAVSVMAGRVFDRETGKKRPEVVRVEDLSFTPRNARRLAELLVQYADLIDGK